MRYKLVLIQFEVRARQNEVLVYLACEHHQLLLRSLFIVAQNHKSSQISVKSEEDYPALLFQIFVQKVVKIPRRDFLNHCALNVSDALFVQ